MANILNCQQRQRRWYRNDIIPPKECLDNPLDYILGLTIREQKLFNVMVYHINKHKLCYPSQETIGSWIGIGRQQTNVLIRKLVAMGLLIKQKCYDDTSLYKLPKFFYQIEVCRLLEPIITAFKFLQDKILNSVQLMVYKQHKNENTTAILMPLKYIYISSPCPTYIVEEYSPGDSGVQRNSFLTSMQEKDIPKKQEDLSSRMNRIARELKSRVMKNMDKELNRWIKVE